MDGIITADEALRIVIFNPAAERMFGCRADEAIGRRLDRFIPDLEHAPDSFHARRANGEEFPAEASISQTTVAGRRLYTVILRDVTARLHTEDTLHQSEARLQAALEVGRMGTWTLRLRRRTKSGPTTRCSASSDGRAPTGRRAHRRHRAGAPRGPIDRVARDADRP